MKNKFIRKQSIETTNKKKYIRQANIKKQNNRLLNYKIANTRN
ncbi:hypothetical protein pb186bvf_003445 [Paramecium bursaria]